jgi:hypothetical protein
MDEKQVEIEKKEYDTPKLTRHGDVEALTAGTGGSSRSDFASTPPPP